MIMTAIQKLHSVIVFNEDCLKTCEIEGKLAGYTQKYVSVIKDGKMYVYNEQGKQKNIIFGAYDEKEYTR